MQQQREKKENGTRARELERTTKCKFRQTSRKLKSSGQRERKGWVAEERAAGTREGETDTCMEGERDGSREKGMGRGRMREERRRRVGEK
eukprot:6205374-Pleurochrysis_carterae.AAC.2